MALNLSKAIPKNKISELCELNSHWNAFFIILEWSSIFLAIYLSERFFNPFVYLLTVIWIGARMHSMGVLMHEASHYRLFENRKLNNFIGELLAWPLTFTLAGYRNNHLAHHQHLNTIDDPDWGDGPRKDYQFPKTRKQMAIAIVKNFIGIGFYNEISGLADSKVYEDIPRSLQIIQFSVFGIIIICSIIFSFWKLILLYWAVPLVTSFIFFAYIRAVAEHYAVDYSHELKHSRNTFATPLEALLLAPYNVGYHLDHHLFPGVPWYKLRKLHKELLKDQTYKTNAHLTKGYASGMLGECITVAPGKRP